MAEKETAYVLKSEDAWLDDYQTIAGRAFMPDVPVTLTELDLTADEARELFKDTPVKKTTAVPPDPALATQPRLPVGVPPGDAIGVTFADPKADVSVANPAGADLEGVAEQGEK